MYTYPAFLDGYFDDHLLLLVVVRRRIGLLLPRQRRPSRRLPLFDQLLPHVPRLRRREPSANLEEEEGEIEKEEEKEEHDDDQISLLPLVPRFRRLEPSANLVKPKVNERVNRWRRSACAINR